MEKIIHKLINEFTEGADTYTHNKSTWLIFTDTKQWVIELTENKTLWYNYNFFKSVFAYASLDCVQNQHLITKWVEDNIINKELTYVTLFRDARDRKQQFEDTLENGVKYTKMAHMKTDWSVDDTIENGVKETNGTLRRTLLGVDDIIQDGVKEIYEYKGFRGDVKDVIQDGVKETKQKNNALLILDTSGRELILESDLVIRDGVKETSHRQFLKTYDVKDTIQDGTEHDRWILDGCEDPVDEVLDNGVKETKPSGYLNPKTSLIHIKWGLEIDNVINDGVKETHREICEYKHTVDYIIQTGVKSSIPRQYIGEDIIGKIIDKGVKETKWANKYNHIGPIFKEDKIQEVLEKGIKNPTD